MASNTTSSFLGAIVGQIGKEKSIREIDEGTSIVTKRKRDDLEGTRQRLFDRNSSTRSTASQKTTPKEQEVEHEEEQIAIIQTAEAPEDIDISYDYTTTDGHICPYNKFV